MSENQRPNASLATTDKVAAGLALGGLATAAIIATGGAALPAFAVAKLASMTVIGLGTSGAYGAARASGLIKDE